MTTTFGRAADDVPANNTSDPGVIRTVGAMLLGLLSRYAAMRARRDTLNRLSVLDDRMLADIGLKRDMIAGIYHNSRHIQF